KMLKKKILWLHKWLGLLSGIIVFLVSISACIYTFQNELKLIFSPEKYYVNQELNESKPTLPLSQLTEIAEKAIGSDVPVSRIDLYPAPNRTWIFRAMESDENAFGYWNQVKFYKRAFVNPYNGEVQA